jgi:hypothetical protein
MRLPVLLVGGTHDGERMDVHSAIPRIRLPVIGPVNRPIIGPDTTLHVMEYEEYQEMRIVADNLVFRVYVADGLSMANVILMLLLSYEKTSCEGLP